MRSFRLSNETRSFRMSNDSFPGRIIALPLSAGWYCWLRQLRGIVDQGENDFQTLYYAVMTAAVFVVAVASAVAGVSAGVRGRREARTKLTGTLNLLGGILSSLVIIYAAFAA